MVQEDFNNKVEKSIKVFLRMENIMEKLYIYLKMMKNYNG